MQPRTGPKITRARAIIACTECHRRRKKCSLEQPCRSCARRYPPAECIYLPPPPLKRRAKASIASSSKQEASSASSSQDAEVGSTRGDEVEAAQAPTSLLLPPKIPDNAILVLDQDPVRAQPLRISWASRWSESGSEDSDWTQTTPPTSYNGETDTDGGPPDHTTTLAKSGSGRHESSLRDIHSKRIARELAAGRMPASFGGGNRELLMYVGVEATMNHVELLNIYLEQVAPWIWSLDGSVRDWVPGYFKSSTWLRTPIASGIMIHVSLGWAAVRRTTIKLMSLGAKPDPKEIMRLSTEGRYLRGKSLEILNNRMRAITDLSNVDDEMIMAVAVFLFFEWASGIEKGIGNIEPHIRALREILRHRGGTKALGMEGYASKHIMLTHYGLAISMEREPFMIPQDLLHDRFIPTHTPVYPRFDGPLFMSGGQFKDKPDDDLHPLTCAILDSMTAIFNSIRVYSLNSDRNPVLRDMILMTAKAEFAHLLAMPSAHTPDHDTANDFIYETVRIAAIIYLRTISLLKPLTRAHILDPTDPLLSAFPGLSTPTHVAQASTNPSIPSLLSTTAPSLPPSLLTALFAAIRHVPTTNWKPHSGIWLWIVQCIHPDTEERWPSPQLKALVKRSTYHVFTLDWQVYVNCMETVLAVQRFVREGRGGARESGMAMKEVGRKGEHDASGAI